ncbi:MAG: Hsp20/alpha crystallin family protein [Vulcanisaeta sp.]|jgi:HSP20 family protein|uniref:Hsp20/alpha crystallin family protein n=1 Tax=Vulcanisaeta sp. EB80 TaxID=1650660 RepID=UPI000746C668|nr:Hsp20/alpha crystallin family protein [Vulcanisaeta sp. EB80]KUO81017.1 MAG: heat-shock protein Hsp20 [Vulcanisaeta sp. JCHS_4]KUO89435.1 MAG: heat-shock protein Hsp20 [Vulcanisaeta sp. MG_3]MCG2864253.1 Hsp20/alpha crystallin family protein [Vulcanisaeta sp.]PVU72145.1 Hsp20/alpha crystallin family protein [Vulcanisaeta sp. SCGC AB-777_J10]MCG2865948.1 Hsp20/alpha crystallin family protein [Vulcanisaeta sp.]
MTFEQNATDVAVGLGKVEAGVNELISKLAAVIDPRLMTREPPIDIFDNGDSVVILVDLPGVKKDSIKVRVGSNYVEIAAEPQPTPTVGKAARIERLSNFRVYRRVELGVRFKVDGAKAMYRDGVLQVIIPKLGSIAETEVSIE